MADSLGCGVIQDGAVAVKGNCIISVGETAEILKKYSAHRYIDGRGKLLMPGLMDAHAHTGVSIFRGYARDYRKLDEQPGISAKGSFGCKGEAGRLHGDVV